MCGLFSSVVVAYLVDYKCACQPYHRMQWEAESILFLIPEVLFWSCKGTASLHCLSVLLWLPFHNIRVIKSDFECSRGFHYPESLCLVPESVLWLCSEEACQVKGIVMEHQAATLPTAKEDGSCQIQPIFLFSSLILSYISTLLRFSFSWAPWWVFSSCQGCLIISVHVQECCSR